MISVIQMRTNVLLPGSNVPFIGSPFSLGTPMAAMQRLEPLADMNCRSSDRQLTESNYRSQGMRIENPRVRGSIPRLATRISAEKSIR